MPELEEFATDHAHRGFKRVPKGFENALVCLLIESLLGHITVVIISLKRIDEQLREYRQAAS